MVIDHGQNDKWETLKTITETANLSGGRGEWPQSARRRLAVGFAETFVEARPGADARACITKAKSTSVWIGFCR
jgi:hypothetical protein